ncbi:MAG: metal-binding protein [Candidatus Dadabacteria bacterium]|nr:metal-binding protein [Candidatus Dadabacteria bacterium]
MRHRKGKLKRQHGIIKGLMRFLEDNVVSLDYVDGVIPGEIKVGSATGENLVVRFKYSTISGAKLIARSGSSIQEVFVVTSEPEKLRRAVEAVGSGR